MWIVEVHALSPQEAWRRPAFCVGSDTRISTRPEMYLTRPLRKSTDNHARSSLSTHTASLMLHRAASHIGSRPLWASRVRLSKLPKPAASSTKQAAIDDGKVPRQAVSLSLLRYTTTLGRVESSWSFQEPQPYRSSFLSHIKLPACLPLSLLLASREA